MKKTHETNVPLAVFKAHLSQYIREVRGGKPLTLMDRHTPVAKVVPMGRGVGRLSIRFATEMPADYVAPPPLRARVDVVRYAAEERQGYR